VSEPVAVATGPSDQRQSLPAVVSVFTRPEEWFSFHEDHTALEEREQTMLEQTWARLHSAFPELTAELELIETATPQDYYETFRRRFGIIGRPAGAPFVNESASGNVWLVGDTATHGFGLDATVESARKIAHQIEKQ